jgi:anti-anti-sigma factor
VISNHRNHASGALVHERLNDVDIIHVMGEADLSSAAELEAACVASARQQRELVVDLWDCTYLDSSILAVIVRLHRRYDPHFSIVLNSSGIVQRIIKISGLDALLPLRSERLAEAG